MIPTRYLMLTHQQESIEKIKSGRNEAYKGPPGTGKSQTIVNLVTEMLATIKKYCSSVRKWQ